MPNISYSDIQKRLKETDTTGLPRLSLTVLRNIMVDTMIPYLRHHALEIGYDAQVSFGEYDTIFQEAVGGSPGLLNQETDAVLVFTKLETLAPSLVYDFLALKAQSLEAEKTRIFSHIEAVLAGIRRQTPAMILWHGFETPLHPAYGAIDTRFEQGQLATVRELNDGLRARLQNLANAYFVDMDRCMARVGEAEFYDQRYWHYGRAPYALEGLREIAQEDFKFIRALKGKNKKCLVLDCDNTLWGGVVGEDGLEGIKLGVNHPGSAYYEFQKEVASLANRGVILALCSKNNEADVWEVFEKHPDMVLTGDQIATAQINWNDKAANLRQIALDLNIGLDSLVLIDDSEFEAELVRRELPQVTVLQFPKARPAEARRMLASCGLFDTLTVSDEDRQRGRMYKAEANRKRLMASSTDLESYYRSLEMVIVVSLADAFSIPRIAQQTQKTNQFNLTTRRYSEEDIRAFVAAPDVDVVQLQLSDRFGDAGIVGTCILRHSEGTTVFDTFLLSCRVLGRGVERVFLRKALELAVARGSRLAVGEYVASKMNSQVEAFYAQHGFLEVGPTPGSDVGTRVFHFNLERDLPAEPDFFKSVQARFNQG